MPEKQRPEEAQPAQNLPEIDVPEELRIGVYTCYCGGNISGVVECDRVAKVLEKQDGVVVSRTDLSMCSSVGQAKIEEDIKNLGVNRVVVGACQPALHEQTFRAAVTRAGLNPYLYTHVGLREQDSWAHPHDAEGATQKAMHLMAAGIAKARYLDPLEPIRLEARRHALVVGGGVAGMKSALDLANQGLQVSLIEKSPFLGGRVAQWGSTFPNNDNGRELVRELVTKVANHPMITIFTQAEMASFSGYVGNYAVKVHQHSRGVSDDQSDAIMAACTQEVDDEFNYGLTKRKVVYRLYEGCFPSTPAVDWANYDGQPILVDGKEITLEDKPVDFDMEVGAIVIATGFSPYQPRDGEYGFQQLPEVITLPQLLRSLELQKGKQELEWNGKPVRTVAMIHCVGSRELEGTDEPHADGQVNNYCSRVCCTATLEACTQLHDRYPELTIYDLHQDIRTYGRSHEKLYYNALEDGVRFLRYKGEARPQVAASEAGDSYPVVLRVHDQLTKNEEIELGVDLVVLAVGFMPAPIDNLIEMLSIPRGSDRFLLEVHPKLRPVETAVNGVVLAGTAQGPMNIQESLLAASAAAAKVTSLLGKGRVELPPYVAKVNSEKCSGDGACVKVCEYEGAIAMETFSKDGREYQQAVVTAANCTGCGACVGVCPSGAIDVQGWTLRQYDAMVEAIGADLPEYEEAIQ